MPCYSAPVDEVLFLLRDVFGIERLGNLPGFTEASSDVIAAILEEGGRFASEVLQPLNRVGDREGCLRHADATVTTPAGFKEAYGRYVEGGWPGLSASPEHGGQGLPFVLATAMHEFCCSANMAFSLYPGLSQSAYAALMAHGSEAQKALYGPPLAAGRWTGTMNLTEPHCGTDLGLIRTRAVPKEDGSYALHGQKIFISAGEHDMAENIVHLVLARIEGAPAGTKGLSLFIVPRHSVSAEGSVGARNGLSCGALEHKMGIHANPTCVMNYDGASGELLGEANRGLQAMFVMMNEARIGVANQGLAMGEVAYQNAAAYAKDRLQGRALTGAKAPERPADPIIVHPDIRRTLLGIRAVNEAGRALILWTALQADLLHASSDAKTREAAEDHLGLLTPVLKGVLTDLGLQNCVDAQQVLGGHGYVTEWGLEQFVRDARIAAIYEGANGIQGLDLVARKLPRNGGRAFMRFTGEIGAFLKTEADTDDMKPYRIPLATGLDHLQKATMWFMQHATKNPDHAGAGSTDYMHLFGLVALGYMWARMAKTALTEPDPEGAGGARRETRLLTGRFFMERLMPGTATRLARITSGADTMMAVAAEAF